MARKRDLPKNIYWRLGRQQEEYYFVRIYISKKFGKKYANSPRMFYISDFPSRQAAIDAAVDCRDEMNQAYSDELAINNKPITRDPEIDDWTIEENIKLRAMVGAKASPEDICWCFSHRTPHNINKRLKSLGYPKFGMNKRLLVVLEKRAHDELMLVHHAMIKEKFGEEVLCEDSHRSEPVKHGESMTSLQRKWLLDLVRRHMKKKNAKPVVMDSTKHGDITRNSYPNEQNAT